MEGSDLSTTEDPFELTARCINNTKKRQLVTRSGLPRLRCCVCHLHHKCAMKARYRVRPIFGTVLQKVHHFKVDVIAGDANAAVYKYYKKKQEYQYLYNCSVAVMLREMQHPPQLHAADDLDCCFMAVLSWESRSGPES